MIEGILRWGSCQRSYVICRSSLQHSLSLRQSVSSQLNLMGTLLTAHIQHPSMFHIQDGLQRKGTLSDARFTAQQGDASRHHTATQYAVQLLVHHIDTRLIHSRNILQIHRLGIRVGVLPTKHGSSPAMPHGHASAFSRLRPRISRNAYLLKSIPLSAARAFTHPLGTFLPAVAANVCYLIFCHND